MDPKQAAALNVLKKPSLLLEGAEEGDIEKVKAGIQNEEDIFSMYPDGTNAMTAAIFQSNLEIINCLLENGFHFEKNSEPFSACMMTGNLEVAECLIKNGIDINYSHSLLDPAIVEASRNGLFEMVKLLINHKADINKTREADHGYNNKRGQSALNEAVLANNLELVTLLVENGANVNQKSNLDTPYSISKQRKFLEIEKYLLEKGAETEKQTETKIEINKFDKLNNDLSSGPKMKGNISI